MKPIRASEKGQALVLIIFGFIGMLSLVALAIDGGNIFADRRQAQNAADASAKAAALAWVSGQDFQVKGASLITKNHYTASNSTSGITALDNNTGCAVTSTGKEFTVVIASNVKMWFAPILGINQITNHVSAVSRACKGTATQPYFPTNAVMSLKTGTCNGSSTASLLMNGSANLQIWGGGLSSNSSDPACTLFQGGQTQIKMAEIGTACGNISTVASSGTFNGITFPNGCGSIITNTAQVSIPPDIAISCPGTPASPGKPGTYTGTFPGSITNLDPGMYCIDGDFKLNNNQKLAGTGVTIVLLNQTGANWNGGSEMQLSAATNANSAADQAAVAAGAIPGLLIYAANGNHSSIDLNGNGNALLAGTVLATGADCYFAGSGQIQKAKLQFICDTWRMNGSGQGELIYDPSVLYIPPNTSTIQLIQ